MTLCNPTALFVEYWGPRGCLQAAPCNKAARSILGKTLHVAFITDEAPQGAAALYNAVAMRSSRFSGSAEQPADHSTDVGQNWGRCNIDFQFMIRTIDPSYFDEGSAEQPAVLQVNPKNAVAMYGVQMQMPDAPILRRTFHTMVAMFQAAHNCDYYITKYHAKPMAQLQSLFHNIALGLRRLEAEEEAAQTNAEDASSSSTSSTRRTKRWRPVQYRNAFY